MAPSAHANSFDLGASPGYRPGIPHVSRGLAAGGGASSNVQSLDILDKIVGLCREIRPSYDIARERGTVVLSDPQGEGFEIKVYDGGRPTLVVLGPWSAELGSERAALDLVEKALSGNVRIRIESCRQRDHSWAAEVRSADGRWITIRENRIRELWTLHPTKVRFLTMPARIEYEEVVPPNAAAITPNSVVSKYNPADRYTLSHYHASLRANAPSNNAALQ